MQRANRNLTDAPSQTQPLAFVAHIGSFSGQGTVPPVPRGHVVRVDGHAEPAASVVREVLELASMVALSRNLTVLDLTACELDLPAPRLPGRQRSTFEVHYCSAIHSTPPHSSLPSSFSAPTNGTLDGLQVLVYDGIRRSGTLRVLNVSENILGPAAGNAVAAAMQLPSLEVLSLRGVMLGPGDVVRTPHPPCCIAPRSCSQCGPQICNPPFRWHSSESQMGTRGITRPLTRTHTLWHHLKVRARRIPEPDEVVELCCPELAGRRATVLGPTAFEDLQRPLVAVQLHEQAPRRTVREMPQQLLTLTTSGGCALLYRQWPEPTEPHKPLPHQRGHQYATEFDTVQAALAGGRLTELDLHSNYIGPEVGRKLLAALESCPALVVRTPSHPRTHR